MKQQILEKAQNAGSNALNILREELQWIILGGLHSAEAFREIAFLGGTCLRLCHGLQRFSEDLDFSFFEEPQGDVMKWLRAVKQHVQGYGFAESEVICSKPNAGVVTGTVRFTGLLFEAGISPHRDQKLIIKIEIDRRPPVGAITERRILAAPSLMALTLHDLPSLMSGKLHAILARPYTKGRDWYDLIWYGSKGVQPNLVFLENALEQIPSHWCQDVSQWRSAVIDKSAALDWKRVRTDVRSFLENPHEETLLTHATIIDMFRAR